jgi:aminotransferase
MKPKGTFYAFPNISSLGKSSVEISELLLEKGRVATIPGAAFGKLGEDHIRLTFTNSEEELNEALRRIEEMLRLL